MPALTTPTKPADLAQRRQALLARATQQRQALAMQTQALSAPMATIDHGVKLAGSLKRHPVWIAGVLIAIVLIKPRRMVAAIDTARKASRFWLTIQPLVARLRR